METSEFKISISVKSYDEKNSENDRNIYDAEKRLISKLLKTLILNLNRKHGDLDEGCVKNSLLYLLYFPRNKPSKSVTVGPGRTRPVQRFKRFS